MTTSAKHAKYAGVSFKLLRAQLQNLWA